MDRTIAIEDGRWHQMAEVRRGQAGDLKDMLTDEGQFLVEAKWYSYKDELLASLISYVEVRYEPMPLDTFKSSVFNWIRTLVSDIYVDEAAVMKFFKKVLVGADVSIPLPKAKAKPKAKPTSKPKAKAMA